MMKKHFSLILLLASFVNSSWAGLPPTTSKDSSDSSAVTTFNFQFPNFTGTHTGVTFSLGVNSVAGGGTGAGSFTSGLPLLGNGTGAFTQGTLSGNTTKFATSTGTLTSGHCVDIDANGNFVDAGAACGSGGGGSPGGSSTDVQYNSGGSFAGNSSFTYNGSGTVTATTFVGALTGNASGSAASFTGSLSGDVSGTQSATSVNKINGTSLAGLATGILKNTTSTGVPSIATSSDVIGLFTSCSGTQYLGADGACHTPPASTGGQFVGAAYIPNASSCSWTNSNTGSTIGAFSSNGSCSSTITVESNPGPGTIQSGTSNLPQITINSMPAGDYDVIFTGSAYCSGTCGNYPVLTISDGTTVAPADWVGPTSTTDTPVTIISHFVYASSGNHTFQLYANGQGGTMTIENDNVHGSKPRFSIVYYPALSTGVGARYYSTTSTLSSTASLVTYNTKDFDTNSAYSSGVYTVPVGGLYHISAGLYPLNSGTSGTYSLYIYHNGSAATRALAQDTTGISDDSISVSDTLNLSVGDTISIYFASGGVTTGVNASTTANYFSIAKF